MIRTWTAADIQFMKENYPVYGVSFCAEKLGKTYAAVKSKARVLNLVTGFRVSDEQGEFIAKNIHLKNNEIAAQLQITEHKVRNYIHKYKLRQASWEYYSIQETEFIKNNFTTLSWSEIANELGRSTDSVRNKVKLLKLKRTIQQSKDILNRTAKHTWYGTGHLPTNTLYDGAITERTDKNGNTYKYIRIALAKWVPLYIYNWEQQNGPVPEGKILRSINGNQLDCNPANWQPVDRATHLELNNWGREMLDDKYIVQLLTRGNDELKPIIAEQSELIELKRNQIILKRAIHECNN